MHDDALSACRVVVHLDLDCFYAQVEQRRLEIPADQPVAVQQWGSLLAVNYVARKFGVLRGEHTSDAIKKCPSIHLPHVDTLGENRRPHEVFDRKHQKAILRRYRLASREIFDVLRRFAPLCEKAGIDEAFLDLTTQAQERLAQMDTVSTNFCADAANAATKVFGISQMDGVGKDAVRDPSAGFPLTPHEQLLAVGAVIATEIRDAIRSELQFTCSTGIATNKLLAKLASPLNKPDGQTIVAPRFVPLLMQHFPLRKVRGLGGKLGKELETLLRQHDASASEVAPGAGAVSNALEPSTAPAAEPRPQLTVAEFVNRFRFDELVRHLGYDTAAFVQRVCAGDDGDDPVNDKKTEVKTLSSVKQFDQRSGDALVRIEQLAYWVRVLSEEIILRCEDERVENKRFPLQLTLHCTRVGEKPKMRKLRIAQTTTVDELCAATMAVLRRDLDSVFPCAALTMHAKDFVALDSTGVSSISSFFTKQLPPPPVASEPTGGDPSSGATETMATDEGATAAEHPAELELKQFAVAMQRRAESAAGAPSKKRTKISAFFHAPAASPIEERVESADTTSCAPVVESMTTAIASAAETGAATRASEARGASGDDGTLDDDAVARFRSVHASAASTSAKDARPAFYCGRCLRRVTESRAEHDDFHFAVDLSRSEQQTHASRDASRSTSGGGVLNGTGKKRKTTATGPLDAFLKR